MKIGRILKNLAAILIFTGPIIPTVNATPEPTCSKSTEEVDGLIKFNLLLYNKVQGLRTGKSPYADTLNPLLQEYSKMLSTLNFNTQEEMRSIGGGSIKNIGRSRLKVLVNLLKHMNETSERINGLPINPNLKGISDTLKSGATALQAVRLIYNPIYCSMTFERLSPDLFKEFHEVSKNYNEMSITYRNPALDALVANFESELVSIDGGEAESIRQVVDRMAREPRFAAEFLKKMGTTTHAIPNK